MGTHVSSPGGSGGGGGGTAGGSSGPAVGGTVEIPLKLPVTHVGAWALQPMPVANPAVHVPYNVSTAQNDSGTWHFSADAGTYTLDMDAWVASTSAIHHVLIDGVEVAAFDVYTGGGGPITPFSQAGIDIATSGDHTIELLASTRNGGSTGWFLQPVSLVLTRTA